MKGDKSLSTQRKKRERAAQIRGVYLLPKGKGVKAASYKVVKQKNDVKITVCSLGRRIREFPMEGKATGRGTMRIWNLGKEKEFGSGIHKRLSTKRGTLKYVQRISGRKKKKPFLFCKGGRKGREERGRLIYNLGQQNKSIATGEPPNGTIGFKWGGGEGGGEMDPSTLGYKHAKRSNILESRKLSMTGGGREEKNYPKMGKPLGRTSNRKKIGELGCDQTRGDEDPIGTVLFLGRMKSQHSLFDGLKSQFPHSKGDSRA